MEDGLPAQLTPGRSSGNTVRPRSPGRPSQMEEVECLRPGLQDFILEQPLTCSLLCLKIHSKNSVWGKKESRRGHPKYDEAQGTPLQNMPLVYCQSLRTGSAGKTAEAESGVLCLKTEPPKGSPLPKLPVGTVTSEAGWGSGLLLRAAQKWTRARDCGSGRHPPSTSEARSS